MYGRFWDKYYLTTTQAMAIEKSTGFGVPIFNLLK